MEPLETQSDTNDTSAPRDLSNSARSEPELKWLGASAVSETETGSDVTANFGHAGSEPLPVNKCPEPVYHHSNLKSYGDQLAAASYLCNPTYFDQFSATFQAESRNEGIHDSLDVGNIAHSFVKTELIEKDPHSQPYTAENDSPRADEMPRLMEYSGPVIVNSDGSVKLDTTKLTGFGIDNHFLHQTEQPLDFKMSSLPLSRFFEANDDCVSGVLNTAKNVTNETNMANSIPEFSTFSEFRNESKSSAKGANRPFVCSDCGKTFVQKSNLNIHRRIHSGEKPYPCTNCPVRFAQKSNLITHMRVHSNEKPFHCNVCNKQFAQKNNLTTHRRVHSGEKPFLCPVCNEKFSQKSNLTTHMRVHSGTKPFNCNVCSESFAQKNNLTKHQLVHSGFKALKCPECDETFAQRSNLLKHMKVHA